MKTKRTRILCALLLAGLCGGALRSRAQSPEAVTGGEQHLSVGGNVNATYMGYGERWIGGAGVSADASLNRWLGLEGEANYTFYRVFANTHATTYLGGVRYQLPGFGGRRMRPYVKFLAGGGEFNFPYNYAHGNYLVMAPGAGVDYRLNYRWRVRLVDFEYQDWPQFTYGEINNYAITTGIRFVIR
jgi:hypothetical protein